MDEKAQPEQLHQVRNECFEERLRYEIALNQLDERKRAANREFRKRRGALVAEINQRTAALESNVFQPDLLPAPPPP